MSEDFTVNLMRAAVAYLQVQTTLSVSRELFSKSYFSLGLHEKIAVDQAVNGTASAFFQALVPVPQADGTMQQPPGFLAGMRADQSAAPPVEKPVPKAVPQKENNS